MYSLFLKKFSKYKPSDGQAAILSTMTDFKLRID